MPCPEKKTEVKQLLGMTTHISKFFPHFSQATKTLKQLLKNKVSWSWGSEQ